MEIIVLTILILLNGFFALSEIALVSSKKTRLEQLRTDGSKGAGTALKLLDNSESFLSAIQVGITLIGIVTGVYGGINIAQDVSPLFDYFEFTRPYADQIALALTVVIITYFSIVIGELVPKTLALNNPDKIAVKIAPMIFYFSRMFYPFVRLLSFSTSLINKLIGMEKQDGHLTEADLRQMIKIASNEGVIEKEQNVLHENVFYFADKKAKHIMTHRTDIEWINVNKPIDSLRETLLNFQHSKIVCCNENLDNFIGILYIKDYFKLAASNKPFSLTDIIVEPLIVPENINAQKILNLMRRKKQHVCCVVNEYGGFEGLVTLHDIIENIVGQIPDEGEDVEPEIFIRDDKSVLVSGDAPVEILTEVIDDFNVDFETIDYSSVGGFVFKHLNKMPQIGDKFGYKGYTIEVIDIDDKKVDKVLIKRNDKN